MESLSLGFGSFELEVPLDRMESNLNSLHGGAARLNPDTVTGDGRAEAAPAIRAHSPMLLSHRHHTTWSHATFSRGYDRAPDRPAARHAQDSRSWTTVPSAS